MSSYQLALLQAVVIVDSYDRWRNEVYLEDFSEDRPLGVKSK
jgi:hypothetical protein